MDFLELFERDSPERGRGTARPPRRGLRGLFDRLAAALDGDADERSERDQRHDRERRRRDEADVGLD
ncbi:MAG: hypothetical protein KJ048_12530 [Dehalococcoidia bacterium]|nr:hypothetical protein [Dehalococcoidia bacterium]